MEQQIRVDELEEYEKHCAAEIAEKEELLHRIGLAGAAEGGELAKFAKKKNKARRMKRRFQKCGDTCLLTPYEGTIATRDCERCGVKVHELCQVEEEVDVDTSEEADVSFGNQVPLTCRACANTDTFPERKSTAEVQLHNRQMRLKGASAALNEAKLLLESKKEAVVMYMGEKERRLEKILTDDLKVQKCEFASQAYVGKHAKIILDNYEKVG